MKYKLGNQGFIRMKHLLLIVLLLLIFIPIAQPFSRYCAFLWNTNKILKLNSGNSQIIRKEIMSYTKNKKIPLIENNLTLSREKRKVKVKMYWTDPIDYFGYFQKPLTFFINDEF